MQDRKVAITVGLFLIIVLCSILFLCFKVVNTASIGSGSSYRIYAIFDNIGGLKVRSPVKIGGVVIGRIESITLKDYKPYVAMDIDSQYNQIPANSALSIKTAGLLGEQYISVDMGLDSSIVDELDLLDDDVNGGGTTESKPNYLTDGTVVENTKPAFVLEDAIGKFLYSSQGESSNSQNLQTSVKE